MFENHTPIKVGLNGLFSRGDEESCPVDHFTDCLNLQFLDDAIANRDFFTSAGFAVANTVRIHFVKFKGQPARLLYLRLNAGHPELYLYDFQTALPTLLYDFIGFNVVDFNICIFNNRCYITLMKYATGTSFSTYEGASFLYMLDSSWNFRLAAGAGPGVAATAVETGTAGHIAPGLHTYAYAYETDSGFITAYSPTVTLLSSTWVALTTKRSKVRLTNVAVGPAGTIKRHILATRAYDSITEGTPEFFFVTTINDNVTTTIDIDFYEQDLIRSAEYLTNNRTLIPCGSTIGKYNNRLVVGGIEGSPSSVYLSQPGLPEAFDSVNGIIQADKDEAEYVSNVIEYRGQLLIFKDARTYSIVDNGSDPVNWGNPIVVDGGIGTTPFGVAQVLDAKKTTVDGLIIASRSGLYYFAGYYSAIPLSFKIDTYWKRLNYSSFPVVQVLMDTSRQRVYVLFPLDNSGPNRILLMDYSRGLSPEQVKWCPWDISGAAIYSMSFRMEDTTGQAVLYVSTGSSNRTMYLNPSETTPDSGNLPMFKTAYLQLPYAPSKPVLHYGSFKMKLEGAANTTPVIYGLDDTRSKTLASIVMGSNVGREFARFINFQSERSRLHFPFQAADKFTVHGLTVFAKPLWNARPYA